MSESICQTICLWGWWRGFLVVTGRNSFTAGAPPTEHRRTQTTGCYVLVWMDAECDSASAGLYTHTHTHTHTHAHTRTNMCVRIVAFWKKVSYFCVHKQLLFVVVWTYFNWCFHYLIAPSLTTTHFYAGKHSRIPDEYYSFHFATKL